MKYYYIMQVYKYLLCFTVFTAVAIGASAQIGTLSPYSRFGLGLLEEKKSAVHMGLGNVSTIWANPISINNYNPATYSLLGNTVFQFDASTQFLKLTEGDATDNLRLSTLDNMRVVFKRNPSKGAFSMGFKRYSTNGYESIDTLTLDNIGGVKYTYKGTGGINKAEIGYSYKVFNLKRQAGLFQTEPEEEINIDIADRKLVRKASNTISLGVNMDYYFGNIKRSKQSNFDDSSLLNTKIVEETSTSSVSWTFGMQSNMAIWIDPKKDNRLDWIFGATYSLGKDLKSVFEQNTLNIQYFGTVESITDTASASGEIDGSFNLPSRMSFGTGFKYTNKNSNDFYVLVDYKTQDWSAFTSTFPSLTGSGQMQNSNEFSIGFVYAPEKSISIKSSSIRETVWRAGYRQNTSYLNINGYSVTENAFSAGLSIPLGNSKSSSVINLGTEFGSRGTDDPNLVVEDFVNVSLGFSFTLEMEKDGLRKVNLNKEYK